MVKAGLTVGNVTWNMWLVAPVFGFVGAGLAHAMHELAGRLGEMLSFFKLDEREDELR